MTAHRIIPSADISSARATVTNWENQLRNIIDGYKSYTSISHAVQKDAVQNGWDARTDKRHGKGWSMEFELIKSKSGNSYLTITDTGTTGLTGRVLTAAELLADLPAEERWGRFENVAFTKNQEEEAIGARGRGKFIFVGASKDKTILYDTVKADGSYRFGFRTIVLTDSPVNSFDDDAGRDKLVQYVKKDFAPIDRTGTRIIIVNPVDELVGAITSGEFLRYLEETWWEIILRYDANICVTNSGDKKTVKIPHDFKLPDSDTSSIKVWKKDNIDITFGGATHRIKHLHFACNLRNEVAEDIRGVAIQRSGMKVCAINIPYVPRNFANSFYGYVSFDRDLDFVMQKQEGIEHYSFEFRKGVALAVKRKLE
ncbi:MAG: hypothetical protein COW92_01670, partial [Candidatus Omnitrophica bacterium CG22_combo_CG10-13_8_21_14_all_43_16]